jgi:hypothetical protein
MYALENASGLGIETGLEIRDYCVEAWPRVGPHEVLMHSVAASDTRNSVTISLTDIGPAAMRRNPT